MNITRRLVLGGLLGLSAASVLRNDDSTPILWGDGVHDDAPALNALLRGDPIRTAREMGVVQGEHPSLRSGTFLVKSRVVVSRDTLMSDVSLIAAPDFTDECLMFIKHPHRLILESPVTLRPHPRATSLKYAGLWG